MQNPVPTHEEIAARAHEIWERSGCKDGCETENWLQAERELAGGRSTSEYADTPRGATEDRGSPRKRGAGY